MSIFARVFPAKPHTPIPRGIATEGPALLAYGFRPFFLFGAVWGAVAMALWMGALVTGLDLGGPYGALGWHAHEMLFGFGSAVLAGFMLTAIPNWTGRLPVSGIPLLGLVLVWVLGRLAMLSAASIGLPLAAALDAIFLPVLVAIAAREIISGRNWKNLKILAGLTSLALANACFHLLAVAGGDLALAWRGGTAIYVMLVALVGGRIVPSFTRNWLARRSIAPLPASFGRWDQFALGITGLALAVWTIHPLTLVTAALAVLAGTVQGIRLWRWHGWPARTDALVAVLHLAYAFVPLGMFGIAAAALDLIAPASSLHLLTVGCIGTMMLAVMTRASLGHTGRPLQASWLTSLSYGFLLSAALTRPAAELIPALYLPLLAASGVLWIGAFALYTVEYAPMLLSPRLQTENRSAAKTKA